MQYGLHTAQVLLTHEDLADRRRYLNARTTLRTLLELGVIPIINENDTVTTDEIRVGDNDTLGALVANLIEADVLIILTDQAGTVHGRSAQAAGRDAGARSARRRCRAGGHGGWRRQRPRPRRHAHQDPRGQARRALGRVDGHRVRARRKHPDPAGCRRSRGHGTDRPAEAPGRAQAMARRPRAARRKARAGRGRGERAGQRRQEPAADRRRRGRRRRSSVARSSAASRRDGREVARGLVNYSAQETARILRRLRPRSSPSWATSTRRN